MSAVKSIGADITAAAKCSFCGKRRYQVSGLAAARAAICTECLALCHEITAEELA